MAREGADVTIAYLPQEQPDAEDTKKMIDKEKRQCLLLPTDLAKRENCKKVVDDHVNKYGIIPYPSRQNRGLTGAIDLAA